MRLTRFETTLVWLVALGCTAVAVGASLHLSGGRLRVTLPSLLLAFAWALAMRSLAAIMLAVGMALPVMLFGVLMTANGSVSTGVALAAGSAAVTAVLGRAVLRELEWWR